MISHLATVNISINVKKLISACRSKMTTGTVEEEEKEASLTHKSVFRSATDDHGVLTGTGLNAPTLKKKYFFRNTIGKVNPALIFGPALVPYI